MWEDPIVAEVHRTREKLAAEFNFDIGAFFADLRKRQAALGARLVHPKKRAEPAAAGRREDFEKYLAAVPNVAPPENDRLGTE